MSSIDLASGVAPAPTPQSPQNALLPAKLHVAAPVDSVESMRPVIPSTLGGSGGFGIDYWKRMSQLGERPPAYASSLTPLTNRTEAWRGRLELIASAKTTILNTVYIIEPDMYGEAYIDALIAARKRGVAVTLVIDFLAFHAWAGTYPDPEVEHFNNKLKALTEAGAVVAWYAPVPEQIGRLGRGMHFKSLIVDGRTAIYGGRNVGDSYAVKWGDFEAKLQGTIVGSLGAETIEVMRHADPTLGIPLCNHEQAKREYAARLDLGLSEIRQGFFTARSENAAHALRGEPRGTMLQLVVCDPLREGSAFERGPNRVTSALVETFKRASKSITVSSNYVNASDELQAELIAAAKRGVEITVITSGPHANTKSDIPYINASSNYPDLLAAGVRILETRTLDHSKVYVIDERIVAFGSYNMEKPADGSLVEGLMFTDDAALVKTAQDHLDNIIATNTDLYVPPTPLSFWAAIGSFFKRFFYGLLAPFV